MVQSHGRRRKNRDAILGDKEGILISPMNRTAVFHHAQPAGGNLFRDPMIEQNHAIGDIFFQAMPGQSACASLSRAMSVDSCCVLISGSQRKIAYQFPMH